MTTSERVTHREVREILRTFQESGWASMTLELDGMRVTVGKDGPPAAAGQPALVASAPAPAPPAPAAPKAVAAPEAPQAPAPEPVKAEATVPAAPAGVVDTAGAIEVKSPTIGAFWVAPSPGEPPFVQVGQTVEAGQQLAIVEVMKLMSPVLAPQAGEIVQICAANAGLVEFDQLLFLIRPTDG
ncbi:acetyl-CoA carboxylase biotin carboxyl carrier protein [Aldersonia kunmingensis]|uniref:acetyl-CoA carboxylase biotin carboxyl carrier protein n=1 Tax=Aldersonia kunmingensis TaxID=408066 RepID=UPI000830C11F|nr:biotin/lipoyl-containing protein [Aldersonia kunmingensis]